MNIRSVITKLVNDGYDLSIKGDKLRIESDRPLDNYQRQYLKQHKQKILQYIANDRVTENQSINLRSKAVYFKTTDGAGTYLSDFESTEEAKEELKCRFGDKLIQVGNIIFH